MATSLTQAHRPEQDRVACSSADVYSAHCSNEARSIGGLAFALFMPFCSSPHTSATPVDTALSCPLSQFGPRQTNSTKSCPPCSACSSVYRDKTRLSGSCNAAESAESRSVSCGNAIQQRLMNCTAPPLPQTEAPISSQNDTMCSFGWFSYPRCGPSFEEVLTLCAVMSLALIGIFVCILFAWYTHHFCFTSQGEPGDFVDDENYWSF